MPMGFALSPHRLSCADPDVAAKGRNKGPVLAPFSQRDKRALGPTSLKSSYK